jgi:DNA polymerase-3 subunit epsilon
MRQIILDTETTGLETTQGHRIIEIGCVEVKDRKLTGNHYHQYIQPDREIDEGAIQVHGITNEFLTDKPRFIDIAEDFIAFIKDAQLVIHNAPFDIGFLNHELKLMEYGANVDSFCSVLDTLLLARDLHPGQRNSLDALCKRYDIDNSLRQKHGALLDAEILADVYLTMTGGQVSLSLGQHDEQSEAHIQSEPVVNISSSRSKLTVIQASASELDAHDDYIQLINKSSDNTCLWNESQNKAE